MSLHPVEAAWRRFRSSPGAALLQECLRLQPEYLGSVGLARLPAEVRLAGAVPWNILALQEARARGEAIGERLSTAGTRLANSVACWAAYREAKTIYTVEPLLADALGHTPWPDTVPTAALRLPSRCPVLTLPWRGETVHVAAHYDLLTTAEASGRLELRLSLLAGDQWAPLSILHLVGDDLGACVRDAEHVTAELLEARDVHPEDRPPDGTAGVFHTDLPGLALTVLLYLGGEPDLVRQVHPGARPDREARMRRRDPERWRDLRDPEAWLVGSAYRAAIERWEFEQAREAGAPTGRTVRPHVRRAHAHLYWTGKGRAVPRIRFLLPIEVRGGAAGEEAEGARTIEIR